MGTGGQDPHLAEAISAPPSQQGPRMGDLNVGTLGLGDHGLVERDQRSTAAIWGP